MHKPLLGLTHLGGLEALDLSDGRELWRLIAEVLGVDVAILLCTLPIHFTTRLTREWILLCTFPVCHYATPFLEVETTIVK